MIVVMAIIGLTVAVAVPMIRSGGGGIALRTAARDLASGLNRARTQAILRGREVRLFLDVDRREFRVAEAASVRLPTGIDLAIRTADTEVLSRSSGAIRFYPDGSSTGGGVRLQTSGDDGRQQLVLVDWMTGRVTVTGGSGE